MGPFHQQPLFERSGDDMAPVVLLEDDGRVTYDPYFLDPWYADELLVALLTGAPWRQEYLNMYGRRIAVPRLTAWFGDPGASYTYSGIRNEPAMWSPALIPVRDQLERSTGVRFNSVLLNRYRHGRDSLSWHADDERELGSEPTIASLSLGVTRTFMLQHRVSGETRSIRLDHGSLLVMSGPTQHWWRHQVPKERDVAGERLNLTFRVIHAERDQPAAVRERAGPRRERPSRR